MNRYLLSIQQPDGPPPPNVDLAAIMKAVDAAIDEMRRSGALVLTGGLEPAKAAMVLRSRHGKVVVTDGPYAETKEHVGGVCVVDAPDLDAALAWGRKLALATTLPIEVRAFQVGAGT
jgi:hypothetical protein